METVAFNSRSELDRLPSGAVPEGTNIIIGIRVASEISVKSVSLILHRDSDGLKQRFPLTLVWSENGYDRYEGSIPAETVGLFWYCFDCETDAGVKYVEKSANGAHLCDDVSSCWQLTVFSKDYTTPDWIKGGLFYHIFVDRFCKGSDRPQKNGSVSRNDWGGTPIYLPDEDGEIKNNDFFGGDLDGIIDKLPLLSSLGVNCIYLSPIFEAASNHKYDTGDYSKIDTSFGDDETFKKLCDIARTLGIRVICDGVFNHTGSDSLYFDRYGHYGGKGAYSSASSPYYKWYNFYDWPDNYECWWGIKSLPRVNGNDEGFREYLLGENGILNKWMHLGCSGFRLDVADELTESFIEDLRICVKSNSEEQLIIGEVWEDASNKVSYGERRSYFAGNELDSVMNYPLRNAIIDYVINSNSEALRETIETLCENYPKPALDCLMNILGTHDTERILTVLSGKTYSTREERANALLSGSEYEFAKQRLYLASLLQFTLPGVPCIFYGDEVGMQGYEDPFCRRCYPWGNEDLELLSWYKKLGSIRKENAALCGGSYRTLSAENGIFVFERSDSGETLRIALNLGTEDYNLLASEKTSVILERRTEKASNYFLIKPNACAILKEKESY